MHDEFTIGIDLGGTRIKTGLVTEGKILNLKIIEAKASENLSNQLPHLEQIISGFKESADGRRLKGIGLAFPGIVNSDKNLVIDTSSKYPDAPQLNLTRWANQVFGVPFKMDNDARLACYGEWLYGAGKGTTDMVMITLGTGIGTSVITNNQLLKGKHYQAGILGGHIIIDYKNQSDLCSCGRYGCPEGIASMWMIDRKAKQDPLYPQSKLAEAQKINWETILEFSAAGDELATRLKQHCLDVWATAIINMVHAYDPERIVIGGGISHSEKELLTFFENELTKRGWCPSGIPELRVASYPDTAAVLGAGSLFD